MKKILTIITLLLLALLISCDASSVYNKLFSKAEPIAPAPPTASTKREINSEEELRAFIQDEGEFEGVEEASLGSDLTLKDQIHFRIDKNKTLDFNSHTIDYLNSGDFYGVYVSSGHLTLKDSSQAKGSFETDVTDSAILLKKDAALSLENIKIVTKPGTRNAINLEGGSIDKIEGVVIDSSLEPLSNPSTYRSIYIQDGGIISIKDTTTNINLDVGDNNTKPIDIVSLYVTSKKCDNLTIDNFEANIKVIGNSTNDDNLRGIKLAEGNIKSIKNSRVNIDSEVKVNEIYGIVLNGEKLAIDLIDCDVDIKAANSIIIRGFEISNYNSIGSIKGDINIHDSKATTAILGLDIAGDRTQSMSNELDANVNMNNVELGGSYLFCGVYIHNYNKIDTIKGKVSITDAKAESNIIGMSIDSCKEITNIISTTINLNKITMSKGNFPSRALYIKNVEKLSAIKDGTYSCDSTTSSQCIYLLREGSTTNEIANISNLTISSKATNKADGIYVDGLKVLLIENCNITSEAAEANGIRSGLRDSFIDTIKNNKITATGTTASRGIYSEATRYVDGVNGIKNIETNNTITATDDIVVPN